VEAGVDLVTAALNGPLCGRVGNWDDHAVNHHVFDAMRFRANVYDQAVSALIEDIFERGLDKRVLVEPMLWSHYDNGPDGLRVEVHTSGPRVGDLVVISGLDVIHAIAGGVLDPGEAFELGLIRLYGTGVRQRVFAPLSLRSDIDRRTNDNQTVDIRARRSRFGLTQ
jgi:hypothetical protein